jgi:hypothetical protein
MERQRVTRPPGLQSIVRLQRTVGNHSTQQILGIGDGEPPPALPPEVPKETRWVLMAALAVLAALLSAGAASVSAASPRWTIAAAAAGALIGFALGWFLRRR